MPSSGSAQSAYTGLTISGAMLPSVPVLRGHQVGPTGAATLDVPKSATCTGERPTDRRAICSIQCSCHTSPSEHMLSWIPCLYVHLQMPLQTLLSAHLGGELDALARRLVRSHKEVGQLDIAVNDVVVMNGGQALCHLLDCMAAATVVEAPAGSRMGLQGRHAWQRSHALVQTMCAVAHKHVRQ